MLGQSATSLPDDGISEVVHQAAGLIEALPIWGEAVEQVHVQKQPFISFHNQGTELQDGGNIPARLPTRWECEEKWECRRPKT